MECIYILLWSFVTAFIGFNIAIFFDRQKQLTTLEYAALSFPLGLGAVSVEMFIIGLAGMQFNKVVILTPWIALLIYNAIFLRPYFKESLSFRVRSFSKFENIIFSLISFEIIYVFFRALIRPIEAYDSVANYALKSKVIYFLGTLSHNFFNVVANNFHGAHPDYPLFVPLAETWLYIFINNYDDFAVKLIFPIYFLSFAIIFYVILKKVLDNRFTALLFTFMLISIKQFNDYATIGVADLLLGINFSISLFYLYLWMMNKRKINLMISILFSALTLWTKNEGLLLAAINMVLLSLFLVRNESREHRKMPILIFIYFLIDISIILSWSSYKGYLGLVNENFNLSMLRFNAFIANTNKLLPLLYEFQKQIFGFKKWNILWILIFYLFIKRLKYALGGRQLYFSLAVFLFFIGYTFMYLCSAVEIRYFTRFTLSRFLLHILPVCVFWVANMTTEDIAIIEKRPNH